MFKPKSSNFRPIFTVMAKSGEVYQRGEQDPSLNSERPRCIFNPSENACGILVYVQKYIFDDLKSIGRNGLVVEPAFIHGLNSQGLKDRVQLLLEGFNLDETRSVSMDGSAFDSNQHYSV